MNLDERRRLDHLDTSKHETIIEFIRDRISTKRSQPDDITCFDERAAAGAADSAKRNPSVQC